ncbi:hypothetical protein H5410_052678 [Solanum commersonii]|uniref:Uncharacterized protein n=1 Tax=Solanum commersonii TaxID=4109 RepID=A0A9J5X1R4_SOLCO|nr:hypothetical protein H5410_052678 [Solanum commersonii]
MEHLIRSGSNHTPLLITFKEITENVIKLFQISELLATRRILYGGNQEPLESGFFKGTRNTTFFHTIMKGRKNSLRVNKNQNKDGEWLEDQEGIAGATINFYTKQFTMQMARRDY